MKAVPWLALTAVALGVAGCGPDPVACNASALVGGVTVEVPGRDPSTVGAVEVCVHGRCAPAMPFGEHALLASGATLDSTEPVEVDVTVAGRREFRGTLTPALVTSGPDGDPCQKRAIRARVTLPQP